MFYSTEVPEEFMHSELNKLKNQLNHILIGKEDKVALTLSSLLAQGHILLEDVPGVGKTTLANGLARSLDAGYGRIQFTPDTLPGDVTGISVYRSNTATFEYLPGAIMHNILLADEINRTSAKTQAALLEAMEERSVTVDGTTYPLPTPFMVIATENPLDFIGTYNLPEAQLDRFLMRISLGYPSTENEIKLAEEFLLGKRGGGVRSFSGIEPVIDCNTLQKLQEEAAQVHVHSDLIRYVVDLVHCTRDSELLSLGAGPRATLALLATARAYAYLEGRDYVTPDDIRKLLSPVLCHRFVLSTDARIKKLTAEQILKELLYKVPVPILR